jgi:nucleotide-binding universal stress UspA family protein
MPAHDDKNRIVVGVDGSPSADAALRWALRQAELTGGSVDAVIAWEYPASMAGYGMAPVPDYDDSAFREIAEKTLTEAISNVVDPASEVRVRLQVVEGNAAEMLLTAAGGAGLLVVGSRGHGGFAGALLGSVGQHCVHHAHCPVVVIRRPAEGT